jgi:REP element-mobilizing transposase RayT
MALVHEVVGMSTSYTRLFVHLVWSTWQRQPWLDSAIRRRVHGHMAAICRSHDSPALAVGGVSDHVHVLVSLHPTVAVADIVKALKVGTTPFVKTRLKVPAFAWQDGYGAFTLHDVEVDNVRRYILQQELHHTSNSVVDDWEAGSRNPANAG